MLLGKVFSASSLVTSYASTFTHQLAADPARGTVLIEEPVHKKLVPVEHLTATLFSHLLEQAQKHAGFPVVDCVIAVPAYFGQFERQAVLDAAKIAGFNVLSLLNGASSGICGKN
jgi:hypoxia up-regulated 1